MGWKRFFRRSQRDAELTNELRTHIQHEVDDNLARGMNEAEARRQAYLKFGSPTRVREEIWQMNSFVLLENLMRDARYALRQLWKSPGFTLLCVLTLALSIGASTAVFTLLDCVVLKPLAYRDSGQLVVAWERVQFLSSDPMGPNPRHFDLWQKRATAFSGLTLLHFMGATGLAVGNEEHPQLVGRVNAYPNLFDVLEMQPFLGRVFRPEDSIAGHDNVAVLTYGLWQKLFHGDPDAIGKTVRLAGVQREVIGVLPAGFHFPDANALPSFHTNQNMTMQEPEIFIPAVVNLDEMEWDGNFGNWIALGRLKPGVSPGTAEAQLNAILPQIVQEMPPDQRPRDAAAFSASVQPMQEAVVSRYKTGIWLLMAVVAGFMLIACLNLANAQLGRALSRNRDAAVRSALEASWWRLLSISLMESLLLGLAGGTAGVLLAIASLRIFQRYSPVDMPRLAEVHVNLTVLLFAVALTIGSSVLFGVMPALRFWSVNPQASLQENSSATAGSGRTNKIRAWLIGLQIFGCTALLLLTGVFSKSLLFLLHQDKGFETGHVAVAEVTLTRKNYGTDKSIVLFDDAVLANLRAVPGVQSAGLMSAMPLEGESWIENLRRTGRHDENSVLFNFRWVSPGYFETMREKLVSGRFFEERDRNLNSVVLSQGVAKAIWQNEDPLGSEVTIEGRKFIVIGIVADSLSTSLKTSPALVVYAHYVDRPLDRIFFVARGMQPASQLISSMRDAIWKYAPDTTITRVKTLDDQLNDSLATERLQTSMLIGIGMIGLLLAMVGIYGVLSFAVAGRVKEIGVRRALGAPNEKIYSLVLGQISVPVVSGLAAGLVVGYLATGVVRSLLYGVKGFDLSVTLIVSVLLLLAAVAAGILPARRAILLDPVKALRTE